ncbi:hypothetical protein KBG31_01745 [Patescibacteria group bacterium]|nr:hypothetical protein [Patescibacteria group bacterium]
MKRILSFFNKPYIQVLLIATFTYLIFFYRLLDPQTFFTSSDVRIYHAPSREYLYRKIVEEKRFPFWTERQYSGFPIYADLENSYLNILNIATILVFGPEVSYKIIHFLHYLAGSFCLYLILRKRGVGVLPFSIANTSYFFSIFFINRQIHFGIILPMYILPCLLYLADLFLERRQLRQIVYASLILALMFYWGHLQACVIAVFALFTYFFIHSYGVLNYKSFFVFWFIAGVLTLLFTLPQLVPTVRISFTSIRSPGVVSSFQGSYLPNMLANIAYPSLFGEKPSAFMGTMIDSKYTYVETNMYLGVVALILGFFGMLTSFKGKNLRLSLFSLASIILFVLFSTAKYHPLLNLPEIPVLSLFRYWGRTLVLASLGISLFSAFFVQSLLDAQITFTKKGVFSFFVLALLLLLLVLSNFRSQESMTVFLFFIRNIPKDQNFRMWLILIFLVGLLVLGSVILSKSRFFRYVFIPISIISLLVLFDSRYFNRTALDFRIGKVLPFSRSTVSEDLYNRRVIVFTGSGMRGMENLYYPVGSPFGYSQLADSAYTKKLRSLGVKDFKDPRYLVPKQLSPLDIYKEIGVGTVIYNGEYRDLIPRDNLDVLNGSYVGEYIHKKEGDIKFETTIDTPGIVKTYIRNYPGWRIKLNGRNVKIDPSSDLFINFFVDAPGEYLIEMKYIARDFYISLVASLIGLLFCVIMSRSDGFRKFIKNFL